MTRPQHIKETFETAIVSDGSKHVSGQQVRCSAEGCEASSRITTNRFSHRLPDEVVRRKFLQKGWIFKKGWLCPEHARPPRQLLERVRQPTAAEVVVIAQRVQSLPDFEKARVAPAPTPNPITPKETPVALNTNLRPVEPITLKSFGDLANSAIEKMGRSDKRRIFQEILGDWDEDRGRYLGGTTDQTIAQKLNVPRAWVEHTRRENFGDSGENEEIESVRNELISMQSKYAAAIDDAMKIASKLEVYHKEVLALRVRVEKIEGSVGARR